MPGEVESILAILASIIDTIILSIGNAVITGLADLIWKIRKLWGCCEEPNRDGGPHANDVTPIFDIHTAAGWAKAAMKLNNPKRFWVEYCGKHPDGTSGAQTPMRGGRSYLLLDKILPPPAEDMIDDIGVESADNAETRGPNLRCYPTPKISFQKFTM